MAYFPITAKNVSPNIPLIRILGVILTIFLLEQIIAFFFWKESFQIMSYISLAPELEVVILLGLLGLSLYMISVRKEEDVFW